MGKGREKVPEHLNGYHLLTKPELPTIAVIAFQTLEGGEYLFAATREILEELAEAFQGQASKMPRKQDLT
jgi:hypothetical protein